MQLQKGLLAHSLKGTARRLFFGLRGDDAVPFSESDTDWVNYQAIVGRFYSETQRSGIGARVTDRGYEILRSISLEGKTVVEIGPGSLPHRGVWNGTPNLYISVDLRDEFHQIAISKAQCPTQKINTDFSSASLELPDDSADIVISFYSLEHLHHLEESVREYFRILKPGGILVGAIPNEGGPFWALGRFFLTRPIMFLKYKIDYDKIIAWEHPNFADEIRFTLNLFLSELSWSGSPFPRLGDLNLNLTSKFVFRKDFVSDH